MSWLGDAWNTVEDGAASLLGIDGPSQSDANQQQIDQANRRGDQQRGQYNSQARQLEAQAGGGYDPAAITKQTNWASMDHAKIKQISEGLDPPGIQSHGDDWIQLGKDLQSSTDTFNSAINTALNGNWTGAAGDKALAAPQGMVSWGKDFGDQMQATGAQAQSVSATAGQVKATVPPVKNFSWGQTALSGIIGGPFGAGASMFAQHQEQQQAKEQAVRVMSGVYSPNYMNAASTMPAFTGPTDPTQPPQNPTPPPSPVGPPPVGPGPIGGNPPRGTYDPRKKTSGPPNPPPPGQHHPVQPPPPPYHGGPVKPPPYNGGPIAPPQPVPQPPSTTTQGSDWPPPGSTDPNNPYGYPGGPGGGRGSQGGGGGFMPPMGGSSGFGGGSGYGGASGFGSASAGAGRAGAGTSAGASAGMGADEEGAMRGGAMAGRPGAAGAAGAGGMGAGGRGGKKEEDKEHKSAAYLVNDDNANDIVGDLPPTVPPVIGG